MRETKQILQSDSGATTGNAPFFKGYNIQPKLQINEPGDNYEQEADHMADKIMRMADLSLNKNSFFKPASSSVQRKCHECEEEDKMLHRKEKAAGSVQAGGHLDSYVNSLGSSGRSMSSTTRQFFEPRFGMDFSGVKIHTDSVAAKSAQSINALAYTTGNNIVFNQGQYSPETPSGQKLLAHELTHVVQQQNGLNRKIQRAIECSDASFCTAYTTPGEIASTRDYLTNYFFPTLRATYGDEVGDLWDSYLRRRPGDSLTPVVFDTPGTRLYESFANNNFISDEQDKILDKIADRFSLGMMGGNSNITMSIDRFITPAEKILTTNFSNPFTIPGNIAGGISDSDAGMDSRRIEWGNVSFEAYDLVGGYKSVTIQTYLHFEVKDTIDFCPGGSGSGLEQCVATIKLSRMEASGEAYDKPFVVRFIAAPGSKTKIVR